MDSLNIKNIGQIECPNCGSLYISGTICEKCGYTDKSIIKKNEENILS